MFDSHLVSSVGENSGKPKEKPETPQFKSSDKHLKF